MFTEVLIGSLNAIGLNPLEMIDVTQLLSEQLGMYPCV